VTIFGKEANMPFDHQVRIYADQLASAGAPPRHTLSPDVVRQAEAADLLLEQEQVIPEPVARVENKAFASSGTRIPIRVYTPDGADPFPIVVYFHGGGWVLCNLDTHDQICRSVANGAGCVVVAVDYRLAPEHRFPAAPEDCYAATQWVAERIEQLNGDTTHLAVAGDSAGGNLAAVVAQMARDRGGPAVSFQCLLYPITDLRMASASYVENANAPFLTRDDMIWFRSHYLRDAQDITNPLASPVLAEDLRGLPPAMVVTAEYDPLRDEGEVYGERLQAAGGKVIVRRQDGLPHGFLGLDRVSDRARQAKVSTILALRHALHGDLGNLHGDIGGSERDAPH
jgi:acetyl esterase